MHKISHTGNHFGIFLMFVMLMALLVFSNAAHATAHVKVLEPRTGTLWAPYIEWSLENPSYSGNPFDLVASATFSYVNESGIELETRITEMFYAGGMTWKFRFAGTRTGTWTFTTTSNDEELSGHTGTVTITANPNPKIKGFLTSQGNKFAKQVGENGELEPFLFNEHQSGNADDIDVLALFENPTPLVAINSVIDDAINNGGTAIYPKSPRNRFFDINATRWDEHTSKNPDLNAFEQFEQIIVQVHSRGLHLHFWIWGDEGGIENRRETPIGVCEEGPCNKGINGIPDKRLQRYIAARLGPLPGWSMGYGFDLEEWVSENQVGEWAKYLHDRFGWQHMLWARNRTHPELDALSYNGFGNYLYSDAIQRLDSDLSRPHLYTERFLYLRRSYWGMDDTRQKRWQYAMAGGIGSWWGKYWNVTAVYPKPEQLITHRIFWEKYMRFDYVRGNDLSNGYVLKDITSNKHFVAYKENTNTITFDMSNINGTLPVIAVDTKLEYQSIEVGVWGAGNQTWNAPYQSDWALAIGDFNSPVPILPPSVPVESELSISMN